MNIVEGSLRRPMTVATALLAVVLVAVAAIARMPRDIFPSLGIPVIYVAQPYGGMTPAQMEGYLTYYYEYHFLYITGIEHVESRSIQSVALIKLQFHPGTDMAQALAETINYANRARAFMPPGTVPPFVMRFDSGSVPVGDLVFSSPDRSVGELQDLALNRVRPLFATLPGVSAPPPFGASQRTVLVTVDPDRLRALAMPIDEVVEAISTANAISPSGNARIGDRWPMVPVNSVVSDIKDLEAVPIRAGASPVFVRDVGVVENGTDITTGVALMNGKRTVYIPVTKRADASTLAVVESVKSHLDRFKSVLPDDVSVSYEFDQSPYVTRAIRSLVVEGSLGAVLSGVMVLLFLRDWRSALIVVLTIPLAVLAATAGLWLTDQTINIMSLGGLALSIGILVDMGTVVVENIHAHRSRGEVGARGVVAASSEVALPLLLSMLCVIAVFVPSFFMTGAPRALFQPLSLAVGLAMIASYALAGTFVPVLATGLHRRRGATPRREERDGRLRGLYARVVAASMPLRWVVALGFIVVACGIAWVAGRGLGTEIFPRVEVGQLQLRLRAPTGSQIERTEEAARAALDVIAEAVGRDRVGVSIGYVGVQPASYPINTIYLWTSGPEEAVLQVQLKTGSGIAIEPLKDRLRAMLAQRLPDVRIAFEPADIVSRVMSLGAPTPIEIDVSGTDFAANRAHAERIREALSSIGSLRDLQIAEAFDYPTVRVDVDRQRAGLMGVDVQRVVRALTSATSSSRYTVPNYWADPTSGVAYQVQVQVPQRRMDSLEEVGDLPVARKGAPPELLRNVAAISAGTAIGEYDRYNMQRTVALTANVQGEDLGHAAARIDEALRELGPPPAHVTVAVRGQVAPLRDVLGELRIGLLVAIGTIFLLLTANFQSIRAASIVVLTVPGVLAGTAVALRLTGTTLNLQSFMGAIMAIGVAVANAILLVSFAQRARDAGRPKTEAAIEAARSRVRPILMTSLAMIVGMLPMALGIGEGAEQAAPLGRAVVGGLVASTITTLFVVPALFAAFAAGKPSRTLLDEDAPAPVR